jgi:membrane protein implicated in regulation of membrane protease activity
VNFFQLVSSQPAHVLWLLSGLLFLGVTMLVGEPSIAALGFAALITAVVALTVPSLLKQILIWGLLSISLAIVMRGMVPNQSKELEPPSAAAVSQPIPAGGVGEVTYEGSFWSARCQVSDVAIASGETVHIVGRQGNTLIVMPSTFVDSNIVDRTV